MGIVFDTSVLIEIEAGNKRVLEELQKISLRHSQSPMITSPTYSEFYYGCLSKTGKKPEESLTELEKYCLLNTTKNSSKIFAELKYETERKGKAIPLLNLLIASIVLDNDMILLTSDEHFRKIPNLKTIYLKC